MRRNLQIAVGLLVMLAVGEARAANRLIAVLPLDVQMTNGKLTREGRASLEEMLRDLATDALASSGWTVLTGENTLQVLQDNGIDPANCGAQSCHLSWAKEIKADKFLSGAVQYVEGEFTASIRLSDTATGQILVSERVRGKTVKELTTAFEGKAPEFFRKGGFAGPQPHPSTISPARAEKPVGDTFRAAGLEWQTSPPERERTWAEANAYCSRLQLAGRKWRLPTKEEFLALNGDASSADMVRKYWGIERIPYWSASPVAGDKSSRWMVVPCGAETLVNSVDSERRVLCVR